jgi:hypothetical protein
MEGHAVLIHPLYDHPIVIPTYDLLNRQEVVEIMDNANIPRGVYSHLLDPGSR